MDRPQALIDLGSSCFMNAILQAIFNMPSVEAMLKSEMNPVDPTSNANHFFSWT